MVDFGNIGIGAGSFGTNLIQGFVAGRNIQKDEEDRQRAITAAADKKANDEIALLMKIDKGAKGLNSFDQSDYFKDQALIAEKAKKPEFAKFLKKKMLVSEKEKTKFDKIIGDTIAPAVASHDDIVQNFGINQQGLDGLRELKSWARDNNLTDDPYTLNKIIQLEVKFTGKVPKAEVQALKEITEFKVEGNRRAAVDTYFQLAQNAQDKIDGADAKTKKFLEGQVQRFSDVGIKTAAGSKDTDFARITEERFENAGLREAKRAKKKEERIEDITTDIETQNILERSKHDAQMIFNEAKANKERALIEKTKKLIANAKEGESEGLKVLLTSYISHLASTLKSMEVPQAQITEEINYFTTGQRKGTITLSRKLSDVLYGKYGFRDISKATNTQIEEARLVVKQDEIDMASAKSANRLTQSAQYKATLPMFLEYKGTALIALSKLLDTISTGSKHDYSELKKKSLEELSKIKEGYGKETGFWTNKPGITHVEAQAIQTIVKEIKSYNKKIEVWESKKNKDAKKSPGKIKDPSTAVGYIDTLNNNKK